MYENNRQYTLWSNTYQKDFNDKTNNSCIIENDNDDHNYSRYYDSWSDPVHEVSFDKTYDLYPDETVRYDWGDSRSCIHAYHWY